MCVCVCAGTGDLRPRHPRSTDQSDNLNSTLRAIIVRVGMQNEKLTAYMLVFRFRLAE